MPHDPLLDRLVEQACINTNATGAAIALARGDEFVCVASRGNTAPDLGMSLNTESGLSAICLHTREMQRCDNAETDPRVNAAACRQLGVRSVLVVPLLQGEQLEGLFEVFSPIPQAFSDRDIQTLYALAWQVLEHLAPKAEAFEPLVLDEIKVSTPEELNIDRPPLSLAGLLREDQDMGLLPEDQIAGLLQEEPGSPPPGEQDSGEAYPEFKLMASPARERGTSFLIIAIVLVALIIGWVLGGGGRSTSPSGGRPAAAPQKSAPPSQSSTPLQSALPALNPDSSPHETVLDIAIPANPQKAAPKPGPEPAPAGGLVVYKNGKVIFRSTAEHAAEPANDEKGDDRAAPSTPPVEIPAETANSFVVRRIEPEYPEKAKQEHVQGAVVLQALVDDAGDVQQLRVVSGDSRLATAAMEAVRHWQFKPYTPNGQPTQFETRITVNFALPDRAAAATEN